MDSLCELDARKRLCKNGVPGTSSQEKGGVGDEEQDESSNSKRMPSSNTRTLAPQDPPSSDGEPPPSYKILVDTNGFWLLVKCTVYSNVNDKNIASIDVDRKQPHNIIDLYKQQIQRRQVQERPTPHLSFTYLWISLLAVCV
jgi:hypothetical protein